MATEQTPPKEREEEIHCIPAVTHKDINRYCNYCPHGCRNCRSVMERARTTVTDAKKESYRKNFEITCVGDHISLRFWSGSRGNKLRVQMGDDGKARVDIIEEIRCCMSCMSDCNECFKHCKCKCCCECCNECCCNGCCRGCCNECCRGCWGCITRLFCRRKSQQRENDHLVQDNSK